MACSGGVSRGTLWSMRSDGVWWGIWFTILLYGVGTFLDKAFGWPWFSEPLWSAPVWLHGGGIVMMVILLWWRRRQTSARIARLGGE